MCVRPLEDLIHVVVHNEVDNTLSAHDCRGLTKVDDQLANIMNDN